MTRPTRGGRRWAGGRSSCPSWCARDHQCTATTSPAGEHRSDPMVWTTPYGRLVATRITRADTGTGRLEVRAVLRLADDPDRARLQAQHALIRTDLAVRAALGLPARQPTGRP